MDLRQIDLLEQAATAGEAQAKIGHAQGRCVHGSCPLCTAIAALRTAGWTPDGWSEPKAAPAVETTIRTTKTVAPPLSYRAPETLRPDPT